jgi:hypothetical protein
MKMVTARRTLVSGDITPAACRNMFRALPTFLYLVPSPITTRRGGMFGLIGAFLVTTLIIPNTWATTANVSPRRWQPLILKGSQMPQLLGQPIDRLEVLSVRDGILQAIPFQVDEVLPDGNFALPDGPESQADDTPGTLDRNDQLVMMLFDLGQRCSDLCSLPAGDLEIEVTDPPTGGQRYAYIAAVRQPHLSSVRYVTFDPKLKRVETARYRLGFTRWYPTDFALQSRMHQGTPNLIRQFQVRVFGRIFHLFPLRLENRDIENHLLAYRVGPVRAILLLSNSVKLAYGLHAPRVRTYELFYRNYVDTPVTVRLPWLPGLFLSDLQVRLYLEFRNELSSYHLLCSGMQGPPVEVAHLEVPLPSMGAGRSPEANWLALYGHGRLLLQTFKPAAELSVLKKQLYFRPGSWPEAGPGDGVAAGTLITGWEELAGGTHHLDTVLADLPGSYSPNQFLRELALAPVVKLHPVPQSRRVEVNPTPAGPGNQH